jgi:putative membrane protein
MDMSTKARRSLSTALAILGVQAIALTAFAQTPATDDTRPAGGTTMKKDHDSMDHGEKSGMNKPVTPQSFASQAATIDKAEIELGQLAMSNSQDPAVKKFAERMVKDHTATSTKLKAIAAKENLTLPTGLDAEHAALKAKLSGLKGTQFDREYSKSMAKGHDKALALFESASQTPQITGDLKSFAASTVPTLRQHQEMAHDLQSKEGA